MRMIIAAAFLLAISMGCRSLSVEPERRETVGSDHVCIGACDHIYVQGGWRVVAGHKHGPNCGHELVNGKWVEAKPADVPEETPKSKTDRQ
jgi:hypothetical protein